MPHRRLKVLLLQARRSHDKMKSHELRCFVDQVSLDPDHVDAHDLCAGPPIPANVRSYDAVMVGGSGEYYVSKRNLPHFEAFLDSLREVVTLGVPTFASCFGYQSMVQALGGEVIHDPDNTEVGTYELKLTEAGIADELFGKLPQQFTAQMGHKDRACRHPEGVPNLASSELSPFQALRIPGKPVWASQFHPELTHETNRERYEAYLSDYSQTLSDEERRNAITRFKPSHHASSLLMNFLHLVFD